MATPRSLALTNHGAELLPRGPGACETSHCAWQRASFGIDRIPLAAGGGARPKGGAGGLADFVVQPVCLYTVADDVLSARPQALACSSELPNLMWMAEKQTQSERETQTMTLADKAEKLRMMFGMEKELPVNAVVTAAIVELSLHAQVKGMNLVQKTDVQKTDVQKTVSRDGANRHVDGSGRVYPGS